MLGRPGPTVETASKTAADRYEIVPMGAYFITLLGNANWHFWRANAAIRTSCTSFDIETRTSAPVGLRLFTPSDAPFNRYIGGYRGGLGPDGTTTAVTSGSLTFLASGGVTLTACDTEGLIVSAIALSAVSKALDPQTAGDTNLGGTNHPWNNSYFAVSPTVTSDANYKQDVATIPDEVLDAWEDVHGVVFRFIAAVAEKGEAARVHTGVVAQQVMEAFAAHGLDATRYGLLCHDVWDAVPEQISVEKVLSKHAVYEQVLVRPAAIDENGVELRAAEYQDGDLISPDEYEETTTVTPGMDAGERYSIRYEELLMISDAYHRRRADRLEARLAGIEARFAALEGAATSQ